MKLKLVALSEEAFIDGCMEAILQNDVSHTHVLARKGEQFLYFTTEHGTFDTVIMSKKHQPLEIEYTMDAEEISSFHEESNDPDKIRESFINYVEMLKDIPSI